MSVATRGLPGAVFFKVSANMTVYNRKTQKILESVVQSELYEASRILFVRKEKKKKRLLNNLSYVRHQGGILESISWTKTVRCCMSAALNPH